MSLKDVIGQDRAVRILSGMLVKGRIPSSYLFAGPSGTGKRYTAFQFVKAINCLNDQNGSFVESCDTCNSCRKIDSLTHPDLRVIIPEDDMIKIEKIRELDEFLSFTPTEGRRKIVLVDNADKMNPNAANAFLKTLEEPPMDSTILLISAKEESLLDTIISRCIKINFVPLSLKASKAIIQRKGFSFSDDQIGISMGSVGKLLSEDLLSKRERAFTLFKHMVYHERAEPWNSRDEMKEWFDITFSLLRDMGMMKVGDATYLLINSDKKLELSDMCRSMDLKGIIECYEKLYDLSRYFLLHRNKSIAFNYVQSILRDTLKREELKTSG